MNSPSSSLWGMPILLPPFIPPSHPPGPSSHPSGAQSSSSELFVGGISRRTDVMHLRKAFSHYSNVVGARIIADRESGKSRGFGFVTFNTNEEASAAIAGMNGRDFHGRSVRVNYATSSPNASTVIPPPSPPNADLHQQIAELRRQIQIISMGPCYTRLASPPT